MPISQKDTRAKNIFLKFFIPFRDVSENFYWHLAYGFKLLLTYENTFENSDQSDQARSVDRHWCRVHNGTVTFLCYCTCSRVATR